MTRFENIDDAIEKLISDERPSVILDAVLFALLAAAAALLLLGKWLKKF